MRLLGIIMLALGVVLLFFGFNSSQVVTEQVVEGVTGRFTSTTMLYILAGIALLAGGAYLTFSRCCNK